MVLLAPVVVVGIACSVWLNEFWPDPTKDEDGEDKWLVTTRILTGPRMTLGHIYVGTPVIVPKDRQDQWLVRR